MFGYKNGEYSLNTARDMVKTVTTPDTAAILVAILDFSESSRVIAPHPLILNQDHHIYKKINKMVPPKIWGVPWSGHRIINDDPSRTGY